ncbi:protein SRC2-like isoform X2 [Momordica charantia]|uniref:Protein SRC2-like isoform X2 n=1 Tax=Momordica charantia TaxID=3673 RepID=A0A6J1CAN5_MOMCH|nr:protein SRC2-like isoform X2 [Momordica charantia]
MALRRDSLTLEINVVSAEGLNDGKESPEMKLYAVVSVAGDAEIEQKSETYVDAEGGGNPQWNFPMKFIVEKSAAKKALHSELAFSLNCKNGDCEVGQVKVPMWQLIIGQAGQNFFANSSDNNNGNNNMQYVSFPVKKTSSGKMEGVLNFGYRFEGSMAVIPPPVTARNFPVNKPATDRAATPVPQPQSDQGQFHEGSGHPNCEHICSHEIGHAQPFGQRARKKRAAVSNMAAKMATLVTGGLIIKGLTGGFGSSSQPPPDGSDAGAEYTPPDEGDNGDNDDDYDDFCSFM